MSLSATLFGRDSIIFKAINIMGLGVPGLLDKWFGADPPPAQRLGEISQQTAKEAEPRVIIWGRVRPIGGNLIHCQKPVKRMVKVKSESGGKGGSKKKQTQKVEHVFRTYAIGVCEGPITAFVRIWRNNKLVYDARGNAWGVKNNPVFLKTFRLYTGAWEQMPDSTLESIWGVGNVPAYRGSAYMVSIDEDLTETGGMVPQWQFEVERAEGTYLTSRPYAVEETETFAASSSLDAGVYRAGIQNTEQSETFETGGGFLESGVFGAPLRETDQGFEHFDSAGSSLVSGVFRSSINTFTAETEKLDSGGGDLVSGVFRIGVINYNPNEFEALDSGGGSLIGGIHAIP